MSIQSQLPHHELGHDSTTRLFGRILVCMVVTPLLLLVAIWCYLNLTQHAPSRREWKTILLLLWLGTLFVSAYMAVPRRRPRRGMLVEFPRDPRTDIQQWEHRKARVIVREVLLQGVMVPLIAGVLVIGGYRIFGSPLSDRGYSTLTFVIWGSMIVLIVRYGIRAWRASVVYRT